MPEITKDFIVAMNYAFKYGCYDAKDKSVRIKAYREFGKLAEDLMNAHGMRVPDGLCGVWWDEVEQYVEPGVIDWGWVKNL